MDGLSAREQRFSECLPSQKNYGFSNPDLPERPTLAET